MRKQIPKVPTSNVMLGFQRGGYQGGQPYWMTSLVYGVSEKQACPAQSRYLYHVPKLARFNIFRSYRARMTSAGLLESWSPWPSRSNTPKPAPYKEDGSATAASSLQQGSDRALRTRFRFSLRHYPPDCPPAQIKWYYAVDVGTDPTVQRPLTPCANLTGFQIPKRKPSPLDQPAKDAPVPNPKKYVAFSLRDSRAIESAFRRLVEEEDAATHPDSHSEDVGSARLNRAKTVATTGHTESPNSGDNPSKPGQDPTRVPVNEDFLFDVDIEKRELAPAYWLGPIYDVRRGSWFYQEGSNLRPCDENLANQLEEGYLKIKPWRYEADSQQPDSQDRPKSRSGKASDAAPALDGTPTSKPTTRTLAEETNSNEGSSPVPNKFQLQTQRLFGAYMNSLVTYQGENSAWILSDDLYSRMSSTVYQRFAGGGHLGGTKVVRGFKESGKAKDKRAEVTQAVDDGKLDMGKTSNNRKRRSAPEITTATDADAGAQGTVKDQSSEDNTPQESKLAALERQMSSIVSSADPEDPAKQEEQARKGDEDEIEQDYKETDGDDPGREIEHLILVTHGIGQRLGLRMENLNFIRDVNKLRKTLKNVYDASPDLQALNNEVEKLPKNCRIQVLPVVWRHLLDFPKQSFKQNSKEQDLTEAGAFGEEERYPSLNDITIEGVPGIRNLITDLALDILLYQSAYREHIAGIVQRECNRIYGLFLQRNPNFKGKISLAGHSLGSAILFDILCRQKGPDKSSSAAGDKRRSRRVSNVNGQEEPRNLGLKFDVEDF